MLLKSIKLGDTFLYENITVEHWESSVCVCVYMCVCVCHILSPPLTDNKLIKKNRLIKIERKIKDRKQRRKKKT